MDKEQEELERVTKMGSLTALQAVKVRQAIEDAGPDHLIVSTTGTPLENIGPALEANYNAMIDAALDYGRR